MIFLIIMLLSSVTCCASHHDKQAMIEEKKRVLLSKQIVGNAIVSSQALVAFVSLQDICHAEPTYHQLSEIRNKISTRNRPGYEVSTVTLPSDKNQVRKRTVSYYKKSENNNVSHRNAALVQALGLHIEISDTQHVPQKKESVISRSSTSESLSAQAVSVQAPQKEVEKPQRESQTKSMTNSDGEVVSPIRVNRHDERYYFQQLADHSAEVEKDMQQLKENFKITLKSRFFDSDSDDSDSDDEF